MLAIFAGGLEFLLSCSFYAVRRLRLGSAEMSILLKIEILLQRRNASSLAAQMRAIF